MKADKIDADTNQHSTHKTKHALEVFSNKLDRNDLKSQHVTKRHSNDEVADRVDKGCFWLKCYGFKGSLAGALAKINNVKDYGRDDEVLGKI